MRLVRRSISRRSAHAAATLVAVLVGLVAAPAQAASPDVVVSEVYAFGGTLGALWDAKFVELFNRGTAPLSLQGWSLQSRSLNGSWAVAPLAGTVAPGGFFLVMVGSPGLGTMELPPEDARVSLPLEVAAGAVAVVVDGTALGCGAAPDDCNAVPTMRDLVGWGTSTAAEGAPAPAPGDPKLGLSRIAKNRPFLQASACADGDANASDFQPVLSSPAGTGSPAAVCPTDAAPAVVETVPANGAVDVDLSPSVTVRFSEPVAMPGSLTVACAGFSGGASAKSVDGITFTASLPRLRGLDRCTVTVPAASVDDLDQIDPPRGLAADHVFSFTTKAEPPPLPPPRIPMCQTFRRAIRLLADPGAASIASAPVKASIAELAAIRRPRIGPATPRRDGAERTTYRVKARLVSVVSVTGAGIRLLLAAPDEPRARLIAGFPNPDCIATGPRSNAMLRARDALIRACGEPTGATRRLSGTAVLTGVGFFDKRSSRGAPNGLTLGATLRFVGSCSST